MSLVVWGLGRVIDGRFLFLVVGGAAGFVTYVGLNLLLGGRELAQLWQMARSRS
jgi:hypothetical protein